MANGFGLAGFSQGLLTGLQAVDNLYGSYVRRQQAEQELGIQRQNSDRISRYYDALAKNQEFDNDIRQKQETRQADEYDLKKTRLLRQEKLPLLMGRLDAFKAGASPNADDAELFKLYGITPDLMKNSGSPDALGAAIQSVRQNPKLMETDSPEHQAITSALQGAMPGVKGFIPLGNDQYAPSVPDFKGSLQRYSLPDLLNKADAVRKVGSYLSPEHIQTLKAYASAAAGNEPMSAKDQYATELEKYRMLKTQAEALQAQMDVATGPEKTRIERELKQTQIELNRARIDTEGYRQDDLSAGTELKDARRIGLGSAGKAGGKAPEFDLNRAIKMAERTSDPMPQIAKGMMPTPEEQKQIEAVREQQNNYVTRVRGLMTLNGMDQSTAETYAHYPSEDQTMKDGRRYHLLRVPDPATGKQVLIPWAIIGAR